MVDQQVAPTAVVTRPDSAKAWQEQAREKFRRVAERIGERNMDKDPDEELRFITEVVEEVRRERHEREQGAKGGR